MNSTVANKLITDKKTLPLTNYAHMRIQKKEKERLQELYDYGILNTIPEKEYNYIVELVATICNTPMAMLNFIGEKETWYKAKLGIAEKMNGTPREMSMCNHCLNNPHEVFQITDTLNDPRFANNPFVVNKPNIRFYASSPLVTPKGNVIGALCVLDIEPRELTKPQLNALATLSKKVIDRLEAQKLAKTNKQEKDSMELLLKKISDRAPGAIFKLLMTADGAMSFPFISNGILNLQPSLTVEALMKDASIGFQHVHKDDRARLEMSLQKSFNTLSKLNEEYRILSDTGEEIWNRVVAVPEKRENGAVAWFGTMQDITKTKRYIDKIEHQNQILRDIAWEQSHVVRAPLARIVSLASTISNFEIDGVNKELLGHIGKSANELNEIINNIVHKSEELKTA